MISQLNWYLIFAFDYIYYFCFSSSSKSVKGLEPAVSEDNGLKLCLSDKFNFIGPSNRENKIEETDGIVFYLFIFLENNS